MRLVPRYEHFLALLGQMGRSRERFLALTGHSTDGLKSGRELEGTRPSKNPLPQRPALRLLGLLQN